MLWQRINRSDPEKCFIVVYNSYSTAAITVGQAVSWDYTTDANGVSVTKPTAAESGFQLAGIVADTSIAAGAYGLLQVYGYHPAVRVRSMTATGGIYHERREAVAAGSMLIGGMTASFCLEGINRFTGSTVSAIHIYPNAIALAAQASYTTKTIAAIIKGCL